METVKVAKKAIKVAILTATPLATHGWGRYTRSLIQTLSGQQVEITLITSTDAPADPDLPVAAYHRVLPSLTPAPRFSTPRILVTRMAVARLTRDCAVTHVIAEPYALAAPGHKPMIVTAHGTYLPQTLQRRVWGEMYRRTYLRAQIICVSRYTESRVRQVLPGANTKVILNGVDSARFLTPPVALPTKTGPTVLAVGQIKARKGFHILAQAMAQVKAAIPDAQAIFIGDEKADPAYVASIKDQISRDGLESTVHWLGRAPEETLLGWFHTADVFALPALNSGDRFEGFGLVYLEASAARRSVIGTRDCGAEDAIRHGETGLLVPQNDVTATAQAIIDLLHDPERCRRMGEAGRAFAAELTWERAAIAVADLYRHSAQ